MDDDDDAAAVGVVVDHRPAPVPEEAAAEQQARQAPEEEIVLSDDDDESDDESYYDHYDRWDVAEFLTRVREDDESLVDFDMEHFYCQDWAAYSRNDPDAIVESARSNTIIRKVTIVFATDRDHYEFPPDEYDLVYTTLGQMLGGLHSLREISCVFAGDGEDGYTAVAHLLTHARQITSFSAVICGDGAQPFVDITDRAMRDHPSLEKLTLWFRCEDNEEPLRNPFPTSLPTLPNLRSLHYTASGSEPSFSATNFGTVPTSLHEFALREFRMVGPWNHVLADVLRSNPDLYKLDLSRCDVSGEHFEVLGEELGNSASLRVLEIGYCPSHAQFYYFLTSAMQKNTSLNEVRLSSARELDVTHALGMRCLLEGFEVSDTIKKLTLDGFFFDDIRVRGMRSYLAATTSLRCLSIKDFRFSGHTTWHRFCSGVAENTSLTELSIDGGDANPHNFLQGMTALLTHNMTLETLHIHGQVNDAQLLLGIIPLCGTGTGLKVLHVSSLSFSSRLRDISLEQGEALLKALQNNYTLSECPFPFDNDSVGEEDEKRIHGKARIILKLNQYGRRYLVEGRSMERGLALLAAVADDLDCLVYHLLENRELLVEVAVIARRSQVFSSSVEGGCIHETSRPSKKRRC